MLRYFLIVIIRFLLGDRDIVLARKVVVRKGKKRRKRIEKQGGVVKFLKEL